MRADSGPNLALVIRIIPMFGGWNAEVFYVEASGQEGLVCEIRSSGDVEFTNKIKSAVLEAANAGIVDVIVDLVNHRWINSTGLGILINLYHEILSNGGRAVLANPNSRITRILKLTQLDRIFVMARSIEEAVQYLLSKDGASRT